MSKNLIHRYIWLVDILNRYGRLSLSELQELWRKDSNLSEKPLCDRTFFHYRRSIEEIFHIEIKCDHNRYYIAPDNTRSTRTLSNWLLDSYAINGALAMADDAADWVEVEDVPSAREWLPAVIEAIRSRHKIRFTYAGFTKTHPDVGILFSPFFLKRFKQRWYMVGMKDQKRELRTYALDRIRALDTTDNTFRRPKGLDPAEIFDNIIGITASKGEVRDVRLKTTPMQAKYFRALPFHASQTEEIADGYSIFSYRLKVNYELVHEILSFGSAVKVLSPPELRTMVCNALRETLLQYEN
ncbi:MAG: WYL domain-containing protein [Clostridium sp.]|nr:WYL domain-containing protein [Prevotella sp.]MCM1429075.1 WYL domain-containing protein [Clostridium sp.]MCM1475394.1 WYL domain-containing protein [Muribaculaceae bacterium]